MGEYLTKDDVELRAKATACLAHALELVDQNLLSKQQVTVVNSFLTDRIEDEPSLGPVARGLRAVIDMKAYSASNVQPVVTALSTVSMQKYSRVVRYQVYQLVEALMDRFMATLIAIGDPFITTYVNLTTSEKDPRNLMISFSLVTRILQNFDIANHVEDLFDVTFCYFPITFEPPKDDPYGITSADLKTALQNCISGNSLLAKFTIPGLIEKLNSSSQTVKLDALKTILVCIEKYSLATVNDNWQEIYDGIKFEVLHVSDEAEVVEEAVIILKTLGFRLDEIEGHLALLEYLDSIQKETREKIQEPQSRLALPAAILVAGVAQSCALAFETLTDFALHLVLDKSQKSPSIDQQKGIIGIVIKFLYAAALTPENANCLAKFKDEIFGLFSKSLLGSVGDKSLRKVSLTGLTVLAQSSLLSPDEIGLAVQYLNDIIIRDSDNELCKNALTSLREIFDGRPELLVNITYPALLAELPDNLEIQGLEDKKSMTFILEALAELTSTLQSFEVLSVRLISKLDVIVVQSQDFKYPLALVTTLVQVAEIFDQQQDMSRFLSKLVPGLITRIVLSSQDSPLRNDFVVDAAGYLLGIIVRNVPKQRQVTYVKDLFDLFVFKTKSDLITKSYDPASADIPTALFVLGLIAVAKDVDLPGPEAVLDQMIAQSLETHSSYTRITCLRLVAALINKWLTSSNRVEVVVGELFEKSATNSHCLETISWIAKGLLLRADNLGFTIANRFCELLGSDVLGDKVAAVYGVLCSNDAVLTKENGVIIRLLYKQRLFVNEMPKIVQGFRNGGQAKVNYIVALAGLLRSTPCKVILPHLETFLPLLVEALEVPNPLIQKAAIDTIFVTILEASDTFSQHISSLVPRLLILSKTPMQTPPSVRVAALTCLGQFPKSVATRYIGPFKHEVIREMSVILDDPRREVRREAVRCRQSWFEL